MAGYQSGPGVGTVVGPSAEGERGSAAEVLSPNTEAGQALIVAAVGIVVLLFTVAREGGIFQRLGNAVAFVVVIAAASMVGQYLARMYVLQYPTGPLVEGIRFDS